LKMQAADGRRQAVGARVLFSCILLSAVCLLSSRAARAQVADYEHRPVTAVEVVLEATPADPSAQAEFQSLVRIKAGGEYTAVAARQSLQDLFASDRVANARIEITETKPSGSGSPIRVRFVVQRQLVIAGVSVRVGDTLGVPVATDEIRARLNLLEPGRRLSLASIEKNADEIQTYLRERGYYDAKVEHTEEPDPTDATGTRRRVIYSVTPGTPTRVSAIDISKDLDIESVKPTLKLQPGALYTRDLLTEDLNTIRQALLAKGYLSPTLNEPDVSRNPETREVSIGFSGNRGPIVNIAFKNYTLSDKKQRELLPLRREGNLDISVIEEGARRLKNRLQEDGYFFAEVTPLCTVTPATPTTVANGTRETCENLIPEALTGHTVTVTYDVDPKKRLTLTDIRITGTNKLTPDDIVGELKSQKKSAISFLPFIGGLGRGFTSTPILEEDRRTVQAHMNELGYRHAKVNVVQGIALTGDSLIITFNVEEGPLTRIADVQVRGATVFDQARLDREITLIKGEPYSRSQVRSDTNRLLNLYAHEGYIEAEVRPAVEDLPKQGADEQVRVIFDVTKEGSKAIVNDIVINGVTGDAGTQRTKRNAIIRAIPLMRGDPLRADKITDAERALYVTDAFRQVLISQQPAGETPTGEKKYDVIIDVEEKRPRVIEYGGGYSSDTGVLGLMELTNVNFMNKLRTAAVRLRGSQRQQLVRFEFIDPRFARYRTDQFAPLALSAQYLRDSTITRFFRSTIDKGTFGIVQRLDENGNPIDEFGNPVGDPEIDRLTLTAETQRILSMQRRSIVFFRYTYEDVRLRNIESLLVKDILLPDQVVRMSRFGTSFVIDTRERCDRRLPGQITTEEERIRSGEVCRYNQTDPTRGQYLTADFSWAAKALGGNTSFMRFLSTYHTYYKVHQARGTILAGNLTVGLARLFDIHDKNGNGHIDDIDRLLPISERFFSGGATTLRGFPFEEAGPRQVIIPTGDFRDSHGNVVRLDPFTVPIGGNAEVVANLEARVPVTPSVQVVPFYDGGNVFRSIGDVFHPKPITPTGNFLEDVNAQNLRVRWSHTLGFGFRFKTPLGGALAIDYGYLLNPSRFLIPQNLNTLTPTTSIFQLHRGQFQFRFSQTF